MSGFFIYKKGGMNPPAHMMGLEMRRLFLLLFVLLFFT
jgi:hypothetical protein